MKSNNAVASKGSFGFDRKCFFIIIGLMLFSMYFPYNHSIAIVYQIVVILLGIWLCRDNSWGFAFILVLNVAREYIAISTMDSFSAYYSLNSSIMMLYIILQIGIKLYQKQWKVRFDMEYIPIVLLGIQMFISQLWATNLDEYNTYFPVVCCIYICGKLLVDEEEVNEVIKISFLLCGFFMAIGVIPYYISHSSLQELTVLINGNGLLVDRNYQSLFLMLCILNSVEFLKEYRKYVGIITKMGIVAIIAADMFIIIVGASRSAILGLAIAAIIYFLVNVKYIGRNIKLIGILLVLLIIAYNIGLLDPVLNRFMEHDVSSGNGRFDLWTGYLLYYEKGNLIQRLFGRGLIGKSIVGAPAHNLFVSMLFSFGFFGEAVFLIYCGAVVINAIKNCKGELIIIIPLLFMCCTLEPYYRIEFALYMTCVLTVLKSDRRKIDNE